MKKLIILSFVLLMVSAQNICSAKSNYQINPVIQKQTAPQGYQTQYPVPQSANEYNNYNYNYNAGYYGAGSPNLQGSVVMVPANTSFSAVLMTPLSSETSKLGDSVSMYLPSDFYYGKNLIAGAGSKINGSVIKVKKGGLGGRNGQLQIKFNTLVTPSGQIIPISASIQTNDGGGILKAGTAADVSKTYARNSAIGAASGAVMGVVMGALSGGSVGKGAIYGTAVGGGMGLLSPVLTRGGNVELPQNSQFEIVLDQPLTASSGTQY